MNEAPSDSLDSTIEPDKKLEEATELIWTILRQKGEPIGSKRRFAGKAIRYYELKGELREYGNLVGVASELRPQLYMLAEVPVEVRLMNGADSTIYVLDGLGNVVNMVKESQLEEPGYIGRPENRDRTK